MKIKIYIVFLLFIGVFLSIVNVSHGASERFTLTSDGTLTMYGGDFDIENSVNNFCFTLFNNSFSTTTPDCMTGVAGVSSLGTDVRTFGQIATDSGFCTASSTVDNSITCGLDDAISGQTGNFYFYWKNNAFSPNNVSFYNFFRNPDLTWNAVGVLPYNPNDARINAIIQPLPYGTTTATNTVNIQIFYKSSAGFDFVELPPQRFGWQIFDAVSMELEKEYFQNVSTGTAFVLSYSTTTDFVDGSKILKTFLTNRNTGVDLAPPDETFFNVATNTYLLATGLNSPRENPANLTQINCETFDIGCQFQKAMVYLFVPPQNVLDRFTSVWTRLANVKPFGYLTAGLDALRGINNTGDVAYTMPAIPFVDSIFAPLNNGISVLLWGVFAFVFYKRIKHIDI